MSNSFSPLADRIRPDSIDGVFGQKHILGEGKILRNMINNKKITNMIFYGPSGTGKTTVANIIAACADMKFFKLNATNCSLSDVRSVIAQIDNTEGKRILLYLDEIQNFNKKQQQSILEFIETGDITLIASTTENPYFYVYNAILSRSTVFEFKPLCEEEIKKAVNRGIEILKGDFPLSEIKAEESAIEHISTVAGGDVRKSLNFLEACINSISPDENGCFNITLELAEEATQRKAMTYDRLGDNHYDLLSAFQKSIRGSDADAAVFYLARLIAAEDLISICRRLLVIACEDIGLAYPMAITIVKSCVDSAMQLGFPEARIPLSQAVLLLATAPKSNSAICAIDEAFSDATSKNAQIPAHLKDSHYKGASALGRGIDYKYPHSYENHYVKQQYLPDCFADRKYYNPGDNKFEKNIKEYWDKIKNVK